LAVQDRHHWDPFLRIDTARATIGADEGGVKRKAWLTKVATGSYAPPVLARAIEPFPTCVRTLDALHLASMEFLRAHGQDVKLASYNRRLLTAAGALKIRAYSV